MASSKIYFFLLSEFMRYNIVVRLYSNGLPPLDIFPNNTNITNYYLLFYYIPTQEKLTRVDR